MVEDIADIEAGIRDLLGQLAEEGPTPKGVRVRPHIVGNPNEWTATEGSWRTPLLELQDWLHLPDQIEDSDSAAFDASLGRLLGIDDISSTPRDEYLTVLQSRLELAAQYRYEFIEELEDESEGTVTLSTASSNWQEKWESFAEEINEEPSGPISASAHTWTISLFQDYAIDGDLNLSPSYQRADVWATRDAQLLIESILRGIPLPSVILLKNNDSEGDHYEIIDGKQRLTSILRFTGSHPRALINVRRKAQEWGIDEESLLETFQKDYLAFRNAWKSKEEEPLTATLERKYHFPFPLTKGTKSTLSGDLEQLRGKYYSEIDKIKIIMANETKMISHLFNRQNSPYRIPVIVYDAASPRQIHEVFSLYNRQGKRLNAEEIRNAAFHELDFMKALLATSGDATDPLHIAPFLADEWENLSSTGVALADKETGYAMPDAGYKRTKALSWIVSTLLNEDEGLGNRSTANHIDGLLKRIQADKNDPLRNSSVITDLMLAIDAAVDVHQELPISAWAPGFRNAQGKGRWQELQLVAVLVAFSAAYSVEGDRLADKTYERCEAIAQSSTHWRRPQKTQSKQQWQFIAGVVREILDLLDIRPHQADSTVRAAFGSSGIERLLSLPRPEWWAK